MTGASLGSVGVAVAVGVAAVLQAAFMGVMTERIGALESMWFTYGLGGLVMTVVLVAARTANLAAWRTVPPYVFLAGLMGLIIVGGIGIAVPRIGVVALFTIVLATQFILGAMVDHFGLLGAEVRPLELTRVAGVLVLILGSYLVLR